MEYYQQHKEQQRAYYQQRRANETPEEKAARLEQQRASVIVSNPNYQQESILENLIGLDSNKTESFFDEPSTSKGPNQQALDLHRQGTSSSSEPLGFNATLAGNWIPEETDDDLLNLSTDEVREYENQGQSAASSSSEISLIKEKQLVSQIQDNSRMNEDFEQQSGCSYH